MSRQTLGHVLIYARQYCEHIIVDFGPDARLPPDEDPLVLQWAGGIVGIGSISSRQLKYSSVVDTMIGLYAVLYTQERFRAAMVDVFDNNIMVGEGYVEATSAS
ncbi:hypothetical protein N7G274_005429 [Stereocaulon virgatum]|uniref:Uncharacterized protein n=1 Tax=Stereocaulon virgatum TaxID=373712 RepID=A0ABR4A762_9LECA